MKKDFSNLSVQDIFEINYFLHKEFKILEIETFRKKTGVLKGITRFFLMFGNSVLKGYYKLPKKNNLEFLFVSDSLNNDKVLYPLHKKLKNSLLLSRRKGIPFPKFFVFWYALPYFFKAHRLYRNSTGYEKKIIRAYFDTVWATFGYLKIAERIVKKLHPNKIIVANDHNTLTRTFLLVGKVNNIKTVYCQHAGTAAHFPPLTMDYALLDGQVSLDKYMTHREKNTAEIYLAGSPRFDWVADINSEKKKAKNRIGVSVNLVDNFERVKSFISVCSNNGYHILLRPHPSFEREQLRMYRRLAENENVVLSSPNSETLLDFFSKINLHVSFESFIHFEAVLAGVQSLYYPFSNNRKDGYGFLKEGFIEELNSIEEISHHIDKPISESQKAYLRKYVANIDELMDGKRTMEEYINILKTL